MNIDRRILFSLVKETLDRYAYEGVPSKDLCLYLLQKVIFDDPLERVVFRSPRSAWDGRPQNKTLRHARPFCGLPIGNLTSQLFGNVYLNPLDQFVKRTLKVRHYGRYVDDLVLVHSDREFLLGCSPPSADSRFLARSSSLTGPTSAGASRRASAHASSALLRTFRCNLPAKRAISTFSRPFTPENFRKSSLSAEKTGKFLSKNPQSFLYLGTHSKPKKRNIMYSIVETGGFQYKVEVGKTYKVPSVDAAVGSSLELKSVLLFSNGKEVKVGTPVLNDASVKVEVLAHDKEDTVIVFKKKRRTRYVRRNGHRQGYTEVLVTELRSGNESEVVDPKVVERNRARIKALAAQKVQNVPLTRKEKIAQGLPKPAKVKKNSIRKSKEA
jgi:ribosomal protein L21